MEIPLDGKRSLVRRVVGPDGECLILRLFLDPEEISDLRRLTRLQALLERHGLPIPRHGRVIEDFAGRGAVLLEEEHIDGQTLAQAPHTPEVIRAAAETFGQLHSVRSPHHGDPLAPESRRFSKAVTDRFQRQVRKLKREGATAQARRLRAEILPWVGRWTPALDALALHSLIFTRPNPANVIITPEGRAYLLDIITVLWGPAARDLAQLRVQTFEGDPAGWEIFRARHREIVGPEIAEESERLLPLFEALYHITQAAALAKRAGRTARPETGARVSAHVEAACALALQYPPPAH